MSLETSLDRLSYLVRSASGVPLSASCVVNRAEILALVEQARADLPVEVEEAVALLRRREDVMRIAEREADTIVSEARKRASELVEGSAVAFRAQIHAQEIVEAATAKARAAQREADDWCDRRLAELEADLERTLGQLRRGRTVLEGRLGQDGTGGTDSTDSADAPAGMNSADAAVAARGPADDPEVPDGQMVIDLRDGRRPGRRFGQRLRPELGSPSDLQ